MENAGVGDVACHFAAIQAVQETRVGKINYAALTYRFQRTFPDFALARLFLYFLSNSRSACSQSSTSRPCSPPRSTYI
jgi:hypothetical protein